jgi:hypothetical protein
MGRCKSCIRCVAFKNLLNPLMSKKILLVLFSFCFLLSSVNAQTVVSDYNTSTDFSQFKTYAWLAPGDSVLNRYRKDKLYGGYIEYAANLELKNRGLKMDTLRPDAILVYYTTTEEIITYSESATLSVGVGVAGPGYYVAGSAPVAGGVITETTEQDGVLKFVMYDTKTNKMVWSASVEKRFQLTDEVEKIVVDYTTKIFKKYPLKKKKL